MSMSFDEFDETEDCAKRLYDAGDYDQCEAVLDEAIAKAKAKLKGETVDDWSEVGDDTTDDGDDNEEDTPRQRAARKALDQIADEVDRIEKTMRSPGGNYYPNSADYPAVHSPMPMPATTTLSATGGSYATGAWPTTKEPGIHPFDDKVLAIMRRDGVSKMQAMSRARIEDPETYNSYQGWLSSDDTRAQAMSRAYSTHPVAKLGQPKLKPVYPDSEDQDSQVSGRDKLASHRTGRVRRHDQQVKKSFEQAVADELARGASTWEVAAQRVVNLYGNSLPHDDYVAKGLAATDAVQSEFFETADCYVDADAHSPRCEALRKCRLSNPKMFKALQSL